MRTCSNPTCRRKILDTEDCVRDFDGRIFCKDCYKPVITTLPKHG